MLNYDVWYKGMVIGNVKASSLTKAHALANKMYSGSSPITVTKV